jgi:hypothetical protein
MLLMSRASASKRKQERVTFANRAIILGIRICPKAIICPKEL